MLLIAGWQELEVQRSELTGNADVELRAKDAEMRRQQGEASAELQVLNAAGCCELCWMLVGVRCAVC